MAFWLRCFQIKSSLTDFPFRALSSQLGLIDLWSSCRAFVVRTVAEGVSKQLSWIVLRRGFSSLSRLYRLALFFSFFCLPSCRAFPACYALSRMSQSCQSPRCVGRIYKAKQVAPSLRIGLHGMPLLSDAIPHRSPDLAVVSPLCLSI